MDSNITSEFYGSAWVHILSLTSCVTLDLSLNLSEPQLAHIIAFASQVCGEASGRSGKSSPPSFLCQVLFRSAGPSKDSEHRCHPRFLCLFINWRSKELLSSELSVVVFLVGVVSFLLCISSLLSH